MADETNGNAATPVDPESFFTDTSEQTAQQPQPADAEQKPPSSDATAQTPTWNGEEWTFKANGKMVTPKSRDELIKYAQLGVNYDSKARALNQQKAELLKLKEEMAQQKAQPVAEPAKAPDLFASPPDPELESLKAKIAELEKGVSSNMSYAERQETARFEQALDSGKEALAKEGIDLPDTEWQELLLEIMDNADNLPDTAIDSPDKVMKLLRRTYYELHPDAVDTIAEKRAQARLEELKKSLGAKTVVEGASNGAAKRAERPHDFREAGDKALEAFDGLT